jgi:hypothetical protein
MLPSFNQLADIEEENYSNRFLRDSDMNNVAAGQSEFISGQDVLND